MKLTLERTHLLDALSHVQNVVERRNTVPILSNVLLSAEGDRLTITATDLDVEAFDVAMARIDQPGSVTAPAQTLFDVVRKLPSGADIELELQSDNERLVLRSGRSRFALPTLPASDFMTLSADAGGVEFELAAADLKRLIEKTKFAMSTEETRYYLNGIYLHIVENEGAVLLRAVATDGHRLALAEMHAPAGTEALPGMIIPRKTVNELRRLVDSYDGAVHIRASDSKITCQLGNTRLTSKLIEGNFPEYSRVIPLANERKLVIDTKAFESAVDRVSTVSTERSRSVKLSLDLGKLSVSVNHADTGHGNEEIEADYTSEAMEVGFNAKYLLELASQIEAKEAHFLLSDPASPALVLDPEDAATRYVLMPLRV